MAQQHPVPSGVLKGLRALVVEDVASLRQLTCRLLDALGCESVAAAGSVASAWSLLTARRFDLLLLDYQLEGEPGLRLVTRLRADCVALNHDLTVVVLTGHPDAARVRECREAGADDVLIKPVKTEELGARLLAAAAPRREATRYVARSQASS